MANLILSWEQENSGPKALEGKTKIMWVGVRYEKTTTTIENKKKKIKMHITNLK